MKKTLKEFSREELLTLVEVYAKNWLAHDGCWFLAAEESLGLAKAIALDTRAWERFAVAEAKRIMRAFAIPEQGGLPALAEALQYRLYAHLNKQELVWKDERTLVFTMVECRVQQTREGKEMAPFPCDTVGMTEFSRFAATVDPRIRTRCLGCPPNRGGEYYCSWEFTIEP